MSLFLQKYVPKEIKKVKRGENKLFPTTWMKREYGISLNNPNQSLGRMVITNAKSGLKAEV